MDSLRGQRPCLQPNPDVAGLGLRLSVYAQALINILHPVVYVWDGQITDGEISSMFGLWAGVLMTATALLGTMVIEGVRQKLTLYHAMLILQLSWINTIGLGSVFLLIFTSKVAFATSRYAAVRTFYNAIKSSTPILGSYISRFWVQLAHGFG